MALIELKGIAKTYYLGKDLPVKALRSISMKVEPGEFVAIMGASGSGKSTLLAILGLLDKADCGEYKLLGKDVVGLSDNEYAKLRSRYLGFVFQTFNLLPRFNVLDNTLLPFLYTEAHPSDRERVINILKKIGLGDRLKHKSNQISGGQQQRVAIARALANQPQIILADEPTGNLDSKSALEIMNILKELNAEGTTIIMVTHERHLAEQAGRIITLKDGEIISDEKKYEPAPVRFKENGQQRKKPAVSIASLINYSKEAMLSLLANKLRSFLSILGVLIGVTAVIAMLAIGTGAQKSVEQTLASMGSNLLQVSTSFRQRGIAMAPDTVTRFTFEDLAALKKIDGVERVVPYVQGRGQIVFGNKNWNSSILGTSPDYQYARNHLPNEGRFFTETEVVTRAKGRSIGKTVANELFGDENPVGQMIRINRVNFTVIGVLSEKGQTGFQNADDRVVIPVTTAMYRVLGRDYINNFDVQVRDAELIPAVQSEIIPIIARLHRFNEQQRENIEVRNMAEMQKAMTEVVGTFTALLGAIAAVSLIVGGIGIMNIMLVMVLERTHEIGLRKALGAENRDILIQFLVEAILICALGGLLGILFGSAVSWIISILFGWSVIVSTRSIILAFTFSVLVGILFGLWPAWRAAKLLPVEALRYE